MLQKPSQRRQKLAERDNLSISVRADASHKIIQYDYELLDLYAHLRSNSGQLTIAGFWPIRSEIDVRWLLRALERRGHKLALPAVLDKNNMVFRNFAFFNQASLVSSYYGTKCPPRYCGECEPDMILLPLAAFDNFGQRLGYGGGYYDRAIAMMRKKGFDPLLIGVGFCAQYVDRVATDVFDVAMDAILTEQGLCRFYNELQAI